MNVCIIAYTTSVKTFKFTEQVLQRSPVPQSLEFFDCSLVSQKNVDFDSEK